MPMTPKTQTNQIGDDSPVQSRCGSNNQGMATSGRASGALDRLAKLVADGEATFPQDMSPEDLRLLVSKTRKLRRGRLVRFIARVIALDMKQSQER